ncbi:MAG: hypothetical protein GF307_09615 [candidate division Zixibacteria bacterium]|nr:hypothetical protein [candidate division Zixibacteria bacterium]
MFSNEAIVSNLESKLKYSLKFNEILDKQYDALKKGDSKKLARYINLMDEYHARLKDIDNILAEHGLKDMSMQTAGDNASLFSDQEISDLFMKTRDIVVDNAGKLQRNKNAVKSMQDKIQEEMKDLTKSELLKNYFDSTESGSFLNFSG